MSNLENQILKTLAFFDIFDYPLTLVEIYKYNPAIEMAGQLSLIDVKKTLDESNKIQSKLGFYFLTGRENLVDTRFERYNIADKKFKKRLRYIKLLARLPFVKMIMICNSLAYQNCPESHDIDMAIITKNGRIWTARFYVVFLLKLLRLRPTDKKKKDQLCPSFFFSQESLNLKNLKLEDDDIFTKYWVSQFYPVYAPGNIYQEFIQANSWLKTEFPNFFKIIPPKKRSVRQTAITRAFKTFFEKFISILPEKTYKKFESGALPDRLKQMANKTTSVVITDSVLKFHDNDIRSEVKKTFEQKISQLTYEQ